MTIRIAIDLEMNADGLSNVNEIIQLGYTIFDTNGTMLYTGGDYIKTGIPLFPYITGLTGISQNEIDTRGVSLVQAINNMQFYWHGYTGDKFQQIIEWGAGDRKQIDAEIMALGIFEDSTPDLSMNEVFGRGTLNLKAVYQMMAPRLGFSRKGGLKAVMQRLNVPFEPYKDQVAVNSYRQRGFHDARTDSLMTAKVFLALQEKIK
jgi:inhibitor of KinA sporulation pathway (predicted exonuclease)